MKLIWRIVLSISLLMAVVLSAWALFFYHAVMEEVNDETDDALELFSENLIHRVLKAEPLPEADNGTNNTYYIEPIEMAEAKSTPHITYSDEMVYISQKQETEPARVLRRIFRDDRGQYYRLTTLAPTVESADLREAMIGWMMILFSACLLLVVGISTLVVWRGTKPLYKLLSWLKTNDLSHGVKPLDNPTQVKEYQLLNEAVWSAVQRSNALYNEQKEFVGNASHEIQTPIAVCQNRLEMLLNSDLTQAQFGEIIEIKRKLSYISRLNRELLLLSKIDNRQFAETDEVDIAALASQSVEDCRQIFEERGLHTHLAADEPLRIVMNSVLATIVVNNLIKNAFIHSSSPGEITVSVANKVFSVANSGTEPLDIERLFRRFHQGRKRENSTGLGLAIAAAAAQSCGLRIDYRFEQEQHHFSVDFGRMCD